jgi:peptidoglycan/LPS O-acetylase OafA/YrhL
MATERINYIDGVRGIAILLVFLAHLSAGVYPYDISFIESLSFFNGGGLIGVQLFFALSGYLITKNLVHEYTKYGNIDLKLFYLRRFWRLYPVLMLACLAYFFFALIFMEPRIYIAALGDIFMALTYTTNLPIFPSWFPDLDWMGHTWSLSVEEQFYLVWPILFLIVSGLKSKPLIVSTTLLLCVVTITIRHYLPSLSYGLLRWDALMLGCLLNFVKIPKSVIISIASIIYISYYAWILPEPISNIDYIITSIACAALISQAGYMNFLNSKIFVYFGCVSYSLYLWHFFFMRLGYPGYLNLTVSLILADVSYRYFEVPILNWARERFKLTR